MDAEVGRGARSGEWGKGCLEASTGVSFAFLPPVSPFRPHNHNYNNHHNHHQQQLLHVRTICLVVAEAQSLLLSVMTNQRAWHMPVSDESVRYSQGLYESASGQVQLYST
jgi:hypothetical protein